MDQVPAPQSLDHLVVEVNLKVIGGLLEPRLPRQSQIVHVQGPQDNDRVVEVVVQSSRRVVEE